MSYDPQVVLGSIDEHVFLVNGLMSICMVAVVIYYVNALKTAARHRAFPVPFAAAGWYAVHDLQFASQWEKWFSGYSHWWLEMWAVSCFFYGLMELFMCYLVFKYGREELLPRLTQKQFGVVLLATLAGITVVWIMIKQILDDDLCLIAFAVTTFWPQMWNTQLMMKRQSTRGMSPVMMWCMLASPIGMFSAWYLLDPYFRSPLWLSFAAVTILWSTFNLWLFNQYPRYVPHSLDAVPLSPSAQKLSPV